MSKSIWYPLCRPDDNRIKIKNEKNIYLYDTRGKQYIDANSGLWNVPLGYSNKHIQQKMRDQLDKVQYVNACEFGTEEVETLSDMLADMHHSEIEKIVFTCTGSESIELAIKYIRKYAALKKNNRNNIAVLRNSYHGSYYGSMSCSGYDGMERKEYGPLLQGIVELSLPFCDCCRNKTVSESCTDYMKVKLEQELETFGDSLAGIIIEPILGSAGVIPLPEWYIQRIDEYARQNDIITVFDEVATGFGRTGRMFCYQYYDVKPDIITMSKAMNNGMLPMGAVAVSKKIVDEFRKEKDFIFHLSTQNGNAMCCAAAIATIEELQRNDHLILRHADTMGKYLMDRIELELMKEFPRIFDVRGKGMMLAIEFLDRDLQSKMKYEELIKLVTLLKKCGVVTEWSYIENLTSCLVLFPPYIIEKKQIDTMVEKIRIALRRILL